MISVCFKYTTKEYFMGQWDYVLCNFKPDNIYVEIKPEDQASMYSSNPLLTATIINDLSELPQSPRLVVLSPIHGLNVQGEISLKDFTHPSDVIYYFGNDSEYMDIERFNERDLDLVYIPTDTTDDMYSYCAYSVVMYDRRLKEWLS